MKKKKKEKVPVKGPESSDKSVLKALDKEKDTARKSNARLVNLKHQSF